MPISIMETSQERKYAQIIQKTFRKLNEDSQELFDKVEVYHQHYRAFMDDDDTYPWDYTLVDPLVFQLLRNIMARMNPESYKVRLDPRNSHAMNVTSVNQATVNWELQEMQKTLIFYRFIFRGLLAGRAYLSTGWKFEKALEIQTGDDANTITKKMRGIINRAFAANIRFQDMFVSNKNNPELSEQPIVIERINMLIGDMYRDNETAEENGQSVVWKPEYLEKIVKGKHFTKQIDYGNDLPDIDSSDIDLRYKGAKSKKDMFTRAQYFSMLKFQTLDGDCLYVPEDASLELVMNEKEENPYWHGHYNYITWTPFPEDDDYDSMGIVQPISDLQVAASSTLNQFLTNSRKVGNPMTVVGKDGKTMPDWMFVNRPDGVIRFPGDINQIKQFQQGNVLEPLMAARREINTTFEKASSMSSMYTSGVSGASSPQINKTATGAKIIDSNTDTNIQLLVSIFGSMALSQLGEHFLELNAQFITEEQEFKLAGEASFQKIKPEEVTANFNVMVNPDTITKINPVVKQSQYMNTITTLEGLKTIKTNVKPVVQALIKSMPEMDGIESVIVDPEQQAQEAIDAIMSGVMPDVKYNMDHDAIIKIIQIFILGNEGKIEDVQLKAFAEYLDKHRAYKKAETTIVTMEGPQPQLNPTDPNALGDTMSQPVDPEAIAQSVEGQTQVPENPTLQLPQPIPQAEMM